MKRATLVGLLLLVPVVATAHGGATVHVESVVPDSAAATAGLRAGDFLLAIDGKEIATPDDLKSAVDAHRPGDTVPIAIRRDDERLELKLTFGERSDGGASMGVRLEFGVDPTSADAAEGTRKCLDWIDETYRVAPLAAELGLDLAVDPQEVLACVERDTRRVTPENAVKYCDNIFKVHCSGLDLLAEIGEALVERCGDWIVESTGDDPRTQDAWKTCTANRIFDRYSREGRATGEAACRSTHHEECGGAGPPASWNQWGGPTRDFQARAAGLASVWPDTGPRQLWSRPLGDGYSAVLFEDGRLYTMYRAGKNEIVACLDAATGATLWEHAYEKAPHERHLSGYGDGPRSTPLISGDLLFTVGVAGTLNALRKTDGEPVWRRELWGDEFAGSFQVHGYGSSPLAYRDSVIVQVGGDKGSLVALDRSDGRVRWKTLHVRNTHCSPRLVELAGRTQLLAFMAKELIGVDPDSGDVLWRYPHENQWGHNINMPAVVGGDTIVVSSPQAGARGLKITLDGQGFQVEEIWSSRKVQFYHVSSVREGEWVYGSSGMMSPALMTAVNARTGEIGWRERGIAKANTVAADGRLVILDEDGVLYLAEASPEEFVVRSRTQLFDGVAWTVPTIVGSTLYVRDLERIVALDLGATSVSGAKDRTSGERATPPAQS